MISRRLLINIEHPKTEGTLVVIGGLIQNASMFYRTWLPGNGEYQVGVEFSTRFVTVEARVFTNNESVKK